jgi:hypothetical protein
MRLFQRGVVHVPGAVVPHGIDIGDVSALNVAWLSTPILGQSRIENEQLVDVPRAVAVEAAIRAAPGHGSVERRIVALPESELSVVVIAGPENGRYSTAEVRRNHAPHCGQT